MPSLHSDSTVLIKKPSCRLFRLLERICVAIQQDLEFVKIIVGNFPMLSCRVFAHQALDPSQAMGIEVLDNLSHLRMLAQIYQLIVLEVMLVQSTRLGGHDRCTQYTVYPWEALVRTCCWVHCWPPKTYTLWNRPVRPCDTLKSLQAP
jgi:hypothetical protein